MRVRPFFWCLLATSCICVLLLAATVHNYSPVVMQIHIDQTPSVPAGFTTLKLHLTDTEGLPIEQAQVIPGAKMTNMYMVTNQITVAALGHGDYTARLQLYMAGPWEISIMVHADGFASISQRLFVQVL